MLGLGVVAHEHPLAHGVRSQLLRVLYLAKLNGVYGHGLKLERRLRWWVSGKREECQVWRHRGAPVLLIL